MGLRRFLVLITTALVILLILAVWFSPSDEDFRVENPFWNGTKDLSVSCQALPLKSLSALPISSQGVTLILVPYLAFTPAELEQLNRFVSQGGTLVLADDYGYGNIILEHLGLSVRFSGQTLIDPLANYKSKYFPRIVHISESPLTSNTEGLILNHATSLENVAESDILAQASAFSALDINDNGMWDDGEQTGHLPVVSHHKVGNGQIILISDPSLFINGMEAMEGNSSFIQNITAATTVDLYIDQSHLPLSDLHRTKNLLTQVRNFLVTPLGTSGLVILAVIVALTPIWHRKKGDFEGI